MFLVLRCFDLPVKRLAWLDYGRNAHRLGGLTCFFWLILGAVGAYAPYAWIDDDGGSNANTASAGDDILNGTPKEDLISGKNGNDLIMGLGNDDLLFGEGGMDTVEGGPGDDLVSGGAWNDSLDGGSGADLINGGPRQDDLFGDRGDDTLLGGRDDTLTGGEGEDLFSILTAIEGDSGFDGPVTIADYDPGDDELAIAILTGQVDTHGQNNEDFFRVETQPTDDDTGTEVHLNGKLYATLAGVPGVNASQINRVFI